MNKRCIQIQSEIGVGDRGRKSGVGSPTLKVMNPRSAEGYVRNDQNILIANARFCRSGKYTNRGVAWAKSSEIIATCPQPTILQQRRYGEDGDLHVLREYGRLVGYYQQCSRIPPLPRRGYSSGN
jgi:hypothetical protein